jgi:hypothetical protein
MDDLTEADVNTLKGSVIDACDYTKYRVFSFRVRLRILWLAFKNIFTSQDLYLSANVHATFGKSVVTAANWINNGDGWKHLSVTFDGKSAVGYVDGERVTKE